MQPPVIQTIEGPRGMVSHINWTLLGWVMIQRAALDRNIPAPVPHLRGTVCPMT